ncbi:hypothetical protein EON66_06815 [archaeon]|nr:MAG: hypothetical protein EON66_06815 [archaeon]
MSDEEYIFGVRFNEEAGAQETTPLQLLVDSVGRQYVPISKPPAEECTAICAAAPYVRLSQLNLEPNSGEAVAPSSLPGLLESPASLASDVDVNTHYNESDREAAFTSRASSGSLSAQFVRDVWAAGADLAAAAPSPASLSPQQVVRRVVNGSAAYNNSSSSARPTAPCGPILRLTGAHPDQTGAAWYGRAQQVREGFDTTFLFRMSSPSRVCRYMDDMYTHCRSRGAGGFAFVVQAWHPTAMGRGYEGLGYADIRNSVAIEFDTNADAGLYEPHENHVSVHTRGAAAGNSASHSFSLGATRTAKLPDLAEGIHTARIVYQPVWDPAVLESPAFDISSPLVAHFFTNAEYASGGLPQWSAGLELISVYVNDDTQPVLIVPINLRATLDIAGSHGRAWVGFTAATGENMWQTHDILAWQFTQLRM